MPSRSLIPLTVILLLGAGCMNNGIEWSELTFTRTRPNEKDLIGTWTPTAKALRDMKRSGGYAISKHELTLSADGTFALLNMPDWWIVPSGESHKQLVSGRGTWRIGEEEDVGTIYVIELVFPDGRSSVNLSHQRPPYVIHITLGDPDSGHYMIFERKEDSTAAHKPVLRGILRPVGGES